MPAALLVIDMQNDYLYEKRKEQFSYRTQQLTDAVNALVHEYDAGGMDVIYIRHIIQNFPTNRLLFGYSIDGTEGAELYSGLDVVSKYIFTKLFGDALTNRHLLELVRSKGYDELHLCGLDECGCVTSTALGCAKRGIPVKILRRGTATVFPEAKVAKAHRRLEKAGVSYV
ncbi:MAG: cysteine hydrolase [Oscillospiraceae bacterium]|nr:cysteine hydrolase [Oscillospiraceae bacterium]